MPKLVCFYVTAWHERLCILSEPFSEGMYNDLAFRMYGENSTDVMMWIICRTTLVLGFLLQSPCGVTSMCRLILTITEEVRDIAFHSLRR